MTASYIQATTKSTLTCGSCKTTYQNTHHDQHHVVLNTEPLPTSIERCWLYIQIGRSGCAGGADVGEREGRRQALLERAAALQSQKADLESELAALAAEAANVISEPEREQLREMLGEVVADGSEVSSDCPAPSHTNPYTSAVQHCWSLLCGSIRKAAPSSVKPQTSAPRRPAFSQWLLGPAHWVPNRPVPPSTYSWCGT